MSQKRGVKNCFKGILWQPERVASTGLSGLVVVGDAYPTGFTGDVGKSTVYISCANQTVEIILIYKIFSENNKILTENCSQRLDGRMGVLVG
ncbi:hypothetical protein [Lyngbya sp. CCY1209]|jgi:hypothetical protein|uniref:hypothetical protein n=1 Tax=Lyngbya sp. CCY1209 TaxID=2886103 RepID=UPI002D1FC47A|nr:hypothetical protein [Lyngbya sp. CCY1209]MEB3886728.1 hypothetical protein [Lyngbya sp. CCY1209]